MKRKHLLGLSLLIASGLAAQATQAEPLRSLSGAAFHTWMGPCGDEEAGWYSFGTDGAYGLQWTNVMTEYGVNLNNGWMRNGRICGLGVSDMGGVIIYNNYVELDPATGQMLREDSMTADNTLDMTTYYEAAAYAASTDRIYGFIQASGINDGTYNFCSSPAGNVQDIKVICPIPSGRLRPKAMCWNPVDNTLYGVSYDGDFIRISYDGEIEVLFNVELDNLKNAKTALAYSPFDGCFLYTPMYYEYATQLYYVYPEEKRMRFIRNFPADNQFYFLLNDDFTYDAMAPAMPELMASDLQPGGTEATFDVRMPSLTLGGTALTGELAYSVYIDNKLFSEGTAAAGAETEVKVGPVETGEHVVRISCRSGNGPVGAPLVVNSWFGNGQPLAPEKVEMTENSVSWTPVTEAELGGYLEPGKMRYEVYINDRFIGSTTETSMAIELDPEVPVTVYHAYVAASCNGQVSGRTESNKVIFGAPLPLPYTVVPTKEQAELCPTFNVDGSPEYGTWQYWEYRWGGDVFASGWSYNRPDDWLILPPVDCPDLSHAYRVTLEAIAGGSPGVGNDERLEVWCGNAPTPEAMNTLIIPETRVKNYYADGWEKFTNVFVPKQSGPTYIAVRARSAEDQYSLVVRNITIEATDEAADVPSAPLGFKITAKSDAELTATVAFTVPSETITGSAIPQDADLKVTVRAGEHEETRAARPGESMSVTVDTDQGDNRISAFCILDGQAGQEASATVFTGTIPPNFVENFETEVSLDNMSVRLTWEPPLGGQQNLDGYYSPEGMHYWLMELETDEYGDSEWVPSIDLGNVLEYTYEMPAGSRQAVKYLGIVAANAAGRSSAIWYVYPTLGTPYKPEIVEDFVRGNGAGPKYTPVTTPSPTSSYESGWGMCIPEEFGDDLWDPEIPYAFINYYDSETGDPVKGRLQLPKFSTEGVKDPGMTLIVWTSAPFDAGISLYASTYGVKMQKIFELTKREYGWQHVVIPMPEQYRDMPWIQLAIDTDLPDSATYALIGGYRFGTVDLSGTQSLEELPGVIFGGIGEVVVLGHEGEDVKVFALDGRCIAHAADASGDVRLKVPAGICTVVAGSDVRKVVVR